MDYQPGEPLANAFMGIMKVYWPDLTFEMSIGTKQRELNTTHVEELAANYEAFGLGNTLPEHYIKVFVNGKMFRKWKQKVMPSTTSENFIDTQHFCKSTAHRFEVQAGMHRLHALKKWVVDKARSKNIHANEIENIVAQEVNWHAKVYDLTLVGEDDIVDVEFLRWNEDPVGLPDSEGDLWRRQLKIAALLSRHDDTLDQEKKQRAIQLQARLSGAGYRKDRWTRCWKSQWKGRH
ncbi:hypothetical protein BDZ91DRAFT_169326 [Kalaharituber pfeilii]|nr:hypothetical protein BDZ91DRAFT_169326 [Kalaharituber pfeilii]